MVSYIQAGPQEQGGTAPWSMRSRKSLWNERGGLTGPGMAMVWVGCGNGKFHGGAAGAFLWAGGKCTTPALGITRSPGQCVQQAGQLVFSGPLLLLEAAVLCMAPICHLWWPRVSREYILLLAPLDATMLLKPTSNTALFVTHFCVTAFCFTLLCHSPHTTFTVLHLVILVHLQRTSQGS